MPKSLIKVANLIKIVFNTKKTENSKVVPVMLVKVNQAIEPNKKEDNPVEAVIESKEKLELDEENKKKKEKEEFDSSVAVLNYLACFILFIIIFTCDLALWISMGV